MRVNHRRGSAGVGFRAEIGHAAFAGRFNASGFILWGLLAMMGRWCLRDRSKSMSQSKLRYQKKADVMGAPVDDEVVLLHIDKGQYYSLKGAGPDLWARLDTPASLDELVEWLCGEYDVSPEQAMSDVERFVSELQQIDVVDVVEAA